MFSGGRPIPRVCAKTILHKNGFLEYLQAVRDLAVSDAERQWIWNHRTQLEGHAVAKFEAMEITDAGAVRAGVFLGIHPNKCFDESVLPILARHELEYAQYQPEYTTGTSPT
jgi:hypothetical protein